MAKSFTGKKRIRKSFGRIPEVAPMPNLIEVQKSSYDHFLQMDVPAEKRARSACRKFSSRCFRSGFLRSWPARIRRATSSSSRNTTSKNASNAA